jgi:hypothetical protein
MKTSQMLCDSHRLSDARWEAVAGGTKITTHSLTESRMSKLHALPITLGTPHSLSLLIAMTWRRSIESIVAPCTLLSYA